MTLVYVTDVSPDHDPTGTVPVRDRIAGAHGVLGQSAIAVAEMARAVEPTLMEPLPWEKDLAARVDEATWRTFVTTPLGEVIEDAAVDDALVRPLHPYTSGLLRSLPHLSPRRGKLASIPGRVPSIMDMPNGCRFKARCSHAVDGCDAEQELRDAGGGRKVRCWRAEELQLPGALEHAATAPIAAMVAQ